MPIDLTGIQLSADTIRALEEQIAKFSRYSQYSGTVSQLSQITQNIGTLTAGEIRLGNGALPGSGYSGLRLGYPGFNYDSEDWNFVGLENDTLQVGIRSSDGKFLAGGGVLIVDEDGITFDVSGAPGVGADPVAINWKNGATVVGQIATWNSGLSDVLYITLDGTDPNIFFWARADTDDYSGMQWYAGTAGTITGADFYMARGTGSRNVMQFRANGGLNWSLILGTAPGATGVSTDVLIRGDTDANLFTVDAGLDMIGIGHASPAEILDISGNERLRGYLDLIEATAPGTPSTGYGRIYAKTDSLPYYKDDSGTEHALTGGGGASSIEQRSTTDNVINTTVAETNLLSFSLPANTLTADGILRLKVRISNINQLGAGAGTWVFKSYFGATSITTNVSVPNNTTAPGHLEFDIMGSGATNTQDLYAAITNGGSSGVVKSAVGTSAIDTTSAVTVKISVTLPASSASIGCTLWNYEAILFD